MIWKHKCYDGIYVFLIYVAVSCGCKIASAIKTTHLLYFSKNNYFTFLCKCILVYGGSRKKWKWSHLSHIVNWPSTVWCVVHVTSTWTLKGVFMGSCVPLRCWPALKLSFNKEICNCIYLWLDWGIFYQGKHTVSSHTPWYRFNYLTLQNPWRQLSLGVVGDHDGCVLLCKKQSQ